MVKKFEPTDFQRRAIEQTLARMDVRKRRKRTADTRKAVAKREARKKADRLEARERDRQEGRIGSLPNVFARPRREALRKLPLPGWQVLCARMEPGAWYKFGELRAILPEYAKGSVKLWLARLMRDDWIERAGNPTYDPDKGAAAMGAGMFLYKIAENRTSVAAEWRIELGECQDT